MYISANKATMHPSHVMHGVPYASGRIRFWVHFVKAVAV